MALELRGAYGRPTNIQDWHDGKDFKIIGGPYCSKNDVPDMTLEFDILEFTNSDGTLVGRIILNKDLVRLVGHNELLF